MNRNGEKPISLNDDEGQNVSKPTTDLLAGADVSRFDKAKKKKNKQRNPRRNDYDNRRREASGERKPRE